MPTLNADTVPYVSVVIPVFDHPHTVRDCLLALRHQTYPHHRFEVIVVDNGSPQSLSSVVHTLSCARLLHEVQPGSYRARNAGIRAARGTVIALTDADCRPHADWLERGVARLAIQGGEGMVAGGIEHVSEAPFNAVQRFVRRFHLQQEAYVRDCHFGATANVFTARSLFDRIGFFNEAHFSGGDAEWGQAVYAAGFPQTYAPDVTVDHVTRRHLRSVFRRLRRITGGRFGRAQITPDAFLVPYSRAEWHRIAQGIHAIAHDPSYDSRKERCISLTLYLCEQCVMMAEWVRLRMGGRPVR